MNIRDKITQSGTPQIRDLVVKSRKITDLAPYSRNARTHTKAQIRQIAESIRKFGWTNPVLVDRDNGIIAGHARVEAAKLLGIDAVPVIHLDALSEAQKRAYILADNKLALNADWDEEILVEELSGILDMETNFDVTITGFATPEIDQLVISYGQNDDGIDPKGTIPDRPDSPVTQAGDVWVLGDGHRLLCGDARDLESYQILLGNTVAQLVVFDPPYNVPIKGNVSGKGRKIHGNFSMACGEMSGEEYRAFLMAIMRNSATFSTDGSLHYHFIDWRHILDMMQVGEQSCYEILNLCIWDKGLGGMGAFYRSQHELVCVFKNGTASYINNIQLGQFGRNRTNVWHYPGQAGFHAERAADLSRHPTVKPVQMIEDIILDASHRGDIVLDPCIGSGTTIMAAEHSGRTCYAMEFDPAYVDVCVTRFQDTTGLSAIHEASGQSFGDLTTARTFKEGRTDG